MPRVIDRKQHKELTKGRLLGPFNDIPFKQFSISPLGVVPKKKPGEYRLIHHLSYPKNNSVNDSIQQSFHSVSYDAVDNAIAAIQHLGRGCHLAKTDIESAFRIIPVHPSDYPYLGMEWKGLTYFDRCLPMGCSSSCQIFNAFSSTLHWVDETKLHIPVTLHILDDFLFFGTLI